ncbi:MAG: hypothetical protein SFZ02_10900 [bacterium]|nr:hypothetical protein [bacterium]
MMKKINFLVGLLICMMLLPIMLNAQTATPSPDDPEITPEITPEATPEVINIIIEPSEGQEIDPPISITLPEGWRSQNGTIVVQDIIGLRVLPFTVYVGEVNGGIGFIVLLWGFESIAISADPMNTENVVFNPFMDGARLLRLALVESECNLGTDVEREYPIGDKIGRGTSFAVVSCPNTVDTRGWFVSINEEGLNFAFYVYAEPIETMDGAEADLQAILDTVRFDVQGYLERIRAEATPEVTPEITAEATTTP